MSTIFGKKIIDFPPLFSKFDNFFQKKADVMKFVGYII